MPTQAARDQRLINLARVLVPLVLLLLGAVAFQYVEIRMVRQAAYERCVDTSKASIAASDARKVEIVRFRQLGTLTRASEAFSEGESQSRDEAYQAMADALQVAVDQTLKPEDCDVLR